MYAANPKISTPSDRLHANPAQSTRSPPFFARRAAPVQASSKVTHLGRCLEEGGRRALAG